MGDSGKHFKSYNKNAALSVIVILTTLIMLLTITLGSIYLFDSPAIVPKETRGKIREIISNSIGNPLSAILPKLGQKITDYNFDKREEKIELDSTYSDWEQYENKEYDYRIMYPENFRLTINGNIENIYMKEDIYRGISIYAYSGVYLNIKNWWDDSSINDSDKFELTETVNIGNYKYRHYVGTTGMNENHYVTKKGNTVLDVVIVSLDDNYAKKILKTIR